MIGISLGSGSVGISGAGSFLSSPSEDGANDEHGDVEEVENEVSDACEAEENLHEPVSDVARK